MGLWRGKKGSSVFYRIANSNNQQKQGIRERNYEPSNPQTNRQASQRLKLLPAQRVYGVLKPVIQRAWQGTKYGAMSRQQYLRYALGMTEGYPYVDKNDSRTIPGAYQISRGTLAEVNTAYVDIDEHTSTLGGHVTGARDVGEVSSSIIAANPGVIQEGDQITMVACWCDAASMSPETLYDARYHWKYGSFYVNSGDTTELPALAIFDEQGVWVSSAEDEGGNMRITVKSSATLCASAIIVSRDGGDGTYLRSTAVLYVPEQLQEAWGNEARQQTARRSYQKKEAAATTDWPVEEMPTPEGTVRGEYTVGGLSGSRAWANGRKALVLRYESSGDLFGYYYESIEEAGNIDVLVDATTFRPLANPNEIDDWLRPSEIAAFSGLVAVAFTQ